MCVGGLPSLFPWSTVAREAPRTSHFPHRGHLCRMSIKLNMTDQKRILSKACGAQAIRGLDQSDTGKPRAVVAGKKGFVRTEDHIAERRGMALSTALLRMPGSRDSLGTPLSFPAVPSSASAFPSSGLCPDNSKSCKPASWKSPASGQQANNKEEGAWGCSSGDRGLTEP